MSIDFLYRRLSKYVFLLLGACLLLISSCKEDEKEKRISLNQLPISVTNDNWEDTCLFEEIRNFKQVPTKIKTQARTVLLEFLDPAEIDRQIKFVKFKAYKEKCLVWDGGILRSVWYTLHYIRKVDSQIISSIPIQIMFDSNQNYKRQKGFGYGKIADDPRYNDYISKTVLDSILKQHDFLDYKKAYFDYGVYGNQFLKFHKKRDIKKNGEWVTNFTGRVNLHTGEFNSRNEWQKGTATNFNLVPQYGGGENIPLQLEKYRHFIDSLLETGQTPRAASEKLVKEGMQYFDDKKPRKAMPLFNLAFLVDSTNANVYWAFGKIKNRFLLEPTKWYDMGLSLDSNNVNLLQAYGDFVSRPLSTRQSGHKTEMDFIKYRKDRMLKFNKAEDYYLKTMALAPKDLETMNSLAQLYQTEDRFEDAEEWYLKALAITPKHLTTMENLAMMHLIKVDCEKAMAYYEEY